MATDASHLLRRPDFQIRREQLDFAIARLDQHVGENRDGVLALDDALEELQFTQQIRLADDQFHVVMTSRGRRRLDTVRAHTGRSRGARIPSLYEGDLRNKEL